MLHAMTATLVVVESIAIFRHSFPACFPALEDFFSLDALPGTDSQVCSFHACVCRYPPRPIPLHTQAPWQKLVQLPFPKTSSVSLTVTTAEAWEHSLLACWARALLPLNFSVSTPLLTRCCTCSSCWLSIVTTSDYLCTTLSFQTLVSEQVRHF